MVEQDALTIIDALLALPFPVKDTREGSRRGGPCFHLDVLQASQDFWDDRSEEIVEAAQAEIDAAFRRLAAALTARWGESQTVDLEPYLRGEDQAPEPMDQLCLVSGEMFVWRPLGGGRWVALAVGQADPEWPIELLVAVGTHGVTRTSWTNRRRNRLGH
jgi:hypothetical protein